MYHGKYLEPDPVGMDGGSLSEGTKRPSAKEGTFCVCRYGRSRPSFQTPVVRRQSTQVRLSRAPSVSAPSFRMDPTAPISDQQRRSSRVGSVSTHHLPRYSLTRRNQGHPFRPMLPRIILKPFRRHRYGPPSRAGKHFIFATRHPIFVRWLLRVRIFSYRFESLECPHAEPLHKKRHDPARSIFPRLPERSLIVGPSRMISAGNQIDIAQNHTTFTRTNVSGNLIITH
jgi:hypothetical protein